MTTTSDYINTKASSYANRKALVVSVALVALLAVGSLYLSRSVGNRDQKTASSVDLCQQAAYCIEEAVYRYEIQNSEGHEPTSLFFLALKQDRDPDSEVIKRLKGVYRVKPISQSVNYHTVIKDKETGEPGVVLRVGDIKWVNDTSVEVEGSAYSGWGDVKGYVYHLMRRENSWVVSDRKFAFES